MEKKKNDFIAQGSILAIASILVRVMGMIYRIPMTAIIGDKGNGFYSYAYSVYTILLLLSSYSLPLAVSKMVSAKAQLGQWRNVKRVFICAIAFAIGIGTTFGLIVLIGAQFFTRVFLTKYSVELDGAVIMGTGFIPDSAAKIGMMLSSLICKTKGERYKSKLLESLTLGSNNKAFAPNRTPDDWLTRDEKAVDKYVNDKLCGFTFTAKAYNDFFKIIHSIAINKKCEGISKELPVLITSGEVDPVGGKKACEKLLFKYESAKITDTSIRIYPNDRHEILNELDKEEVYKDIADWLISKI